jgi:hypothetical protein
MDPLESQIRLVSFFDTPDLALDRHGIVVRARRVQGRGDDSVIKLRPVQPKELKAQLRRSPDMVVELDAMPGGYVCSATLKNRLGTNDVKRALAASVPLRKLFSKLAARVLRRARPGGHRARRGSPCSAHRRLQARARSATGSGASSSPRRGCTRTARGSSSSRPSARPPTCSGSPWRGGPSSRVRAWTSAASSRPRRGPLWSTSRGISGAERLTTRSRSPAFCVTDRGARQAGALTLGRMARPQPAPARDRARRLFASPWPTTRSSCARRSARILARESGLEFVATCEDGDAIARGGRGRARPTSSSTDVRMPPIGRRRGHPRRASAAGSSTLRSGSSC